MSIVTYDFKYIDDIREWSVPDSGVYQLEVWGAQGGCYTSTIGGYGGYATGFINLNKDQVLYIVVGGSGVNTPSTPIVNPGGYNGGGYGVITGVDVGAGGGGGWYGGKARWDGMAGGGSGYIGSSLLYDKYMVGYSVTTSSDLDTKTLSVNTSSQTAISDTPKIGHGYARISLIEKLPDSTVNYLSTYRRTRFPGLLINES